MAKKKTPEQLKEEANKIMQEARRKQAALIREAKELENRKYEDLGKKCIEFLEKKIDKEELLLYAKKQELVLEEESDSASAVDTKELSDV